MKIHLLTWLFFVALISSIVNTVLIYSQCLPDQKSILIQLKNSLVFENSTSTKLVNWNQTSDCCVWNGVKCGGGGENSGRVIGLDLSSEFISGTINSSSSLFNLQYLQSLNLAFNSFVDTKIPSGFSKLTNLTYLNMSNAGFSGQIPIEISYLTKLVTLDVTILYFLGNEPLKLENPNLGALVQNWENLENLYLDGVNISANGYEWCQALSSSLPILQVMSLTGCKLTGPIDSSLAKLQSLSVIRLDSNNLSSPVPDFLANFANLTVLHLSFCGLIGKFPEKIFQVQKLQIIDLLNNEHLQGSLPEFLPQDGSLETLAISNTNFSGQLPDSIGNLKKLSRIELSSCNFNGSIPNSMANLTQLTYLDFSFNAFTGPVPSLRLSRNLTQIMLPYNNLNGQIFSQDWEGFQNLENFDLRSNSLTGSVPSSLFSLPSLRKIQLSNNQFTSLFDNIPNINSYSLDTLDLSSNRFEGPIHDSVFELRGLNILLLSYNNFNGTVDPSLIQNLVNLTTLDLSFNDLSMNMSGNSLAFSSSPQFTTLKLASCKLNVFPNLKHQLKLNYLDLSDNQIRGEIPIWVWNKSLNQLNLSHNMLVDFEKPLPNFTLSLHTLDLHSNLLQGQVPILKLSATFLDYSSNRFSSIIPYGIGNNFNYTFFFSLSNNSLIGPIPGSICNGLYLQVLDLSFNELNGTIPPCLLRMGETLGVLNLRGNRLSGNIPDNFPKNCNLMTIDFNENFINGPIPRTLANCTLLEVLNLGNNQIVDDFPCWLQNTSSLRVLVLRSNQFHGSVECPNMFTSNLKMLQIVDLASNKFEGNLSPQCFESWNAMMDDVDALESEAGHIRFGYLKLSQLYYQDTVTVTFKGLELELVKILTVFTSIDFSNNGFNGVIPDIIGRLKSLYVLNLSSNAFTGPIPNSLGNLTQLESLDLSYNNLTGNIPMELTNLNFLSVLDLSFNHLEGPIPRGTQFDTFSNTSYLGNEGLCGAPLTVKCSNSSTKTTYFNINCNSRFHWQFIFTGLGFGFGAAMIIGPIVFWEKGRKWYDNRIDGLLSMIFSCLGLVYTSYDDLCDENETEDITSTELIEFNGKFFDDDDHHNNNEEIQNHTDEKSFLGPYCVFCSKLDICRKKAIHNQDCTCHCSIPRSHSSASSLQSFSST